MKLHTRAQLYDYNFRSARVAYIGKRFILQIHYNSGGMRNHLNLKMEEYYVLVGIVIIVVVVDTKEEFK